MHKKNFNQCPPKPCGCEHKDPCECHHHDCGCPDPKPVCGGPNNVFPVNYHVIDDICELKEVLSEVFIKFDGDPAYYGKEQYSLLLRSIAKSLLYLYKRDHRSLRFDIVKELPEIGEIGTVYLIEKPEDEQEEGNKYTEYLYLGCKGYELLGGEGGGSVDPYEFPGIVSDSEDYLLVEEDEDGIWHLSLSDEAIALLEQIPGIVEQLSALDSKIDAEKERAIGVEGEIAEKASEAYRIASEAKDADDAIKQDVEANASEIATLKARTLWVKKGDEAAVQVQPVNNKYTIEVPAACDCKLSQVYTSPYKIGGIEVGDQFGPGCELGDSFEDLVKRMFQAPPAPATLGYHYAWNVSCEWDEDEEEVIGGDVMTLTEEILVDGVSLDTVEHSAIPMTAFPEDGIAQKDTLTETYGFIVVLGRPDVNPTIADLNGAIGTLTKLKEIVAEDGNSYGVYIIPTLVSGPANGASYKNLTV